MKKGGRRKRKRKMYMDVNQPEHLNKVHADKCIKFMIRVPSLA